MNTRELMIGDFVKLDFYDTPYADPEDAVWKNGQITCIHSGNLVDADFEGKAEIKIEVEDVRPIPLAPEILEKNGLRFSGICTWELHEKNLDIFVVPVQPDNEWWDGFSTRIEVCTNRSDFLIEAAEQIYVHQLQQMLRLAGIEKEIVL